MFGGGRNLLSGVSIAPKATRDPLRPTAPGRNLVDAIVDRALTLLPTEYPPSTGIAAPVMKSEAGLARKTAMPARSPGTPSGRLMPGLSAPAGESDFYFVPAEDPETAFQCILELKAASPNALVQTRSATSKRALPDEPRRRRAFGQQRIASGVEPAGERKVERFGWTFAPRDKVMQIQNDYDNEVYNGDIGYIEDVDPEAGELMVSFDACSVAYGSGEPDTLVPAHAATIHKSQGSEYPAVIIPVLTRTTRCCSEISSIPASRAARGWWFSSARRRPSRSRFAMFLAGAAGRSSTNGFGSARPPDRRTHRRRIEFIEG
jgi:hypothetical protein